MALGDETIGLSGTKYHIVREGSVISPLRQVSENAHV